MVDIVNIKKLNKEAAVKALSLVARRWLENRGLEAFVVVDGAKRKAESGYQEIPAWASGEASPDDESGDFSRKMLIALSDSEDNEVRSWTSEALREVATAKAYIIDPLTLSIYGVILIGPILAARVKTIGAVEFYECIPKPLAGVIKAGASIIVPEAGK